MGGDEMHEPPHRLVVTASGSEPRVRFVPGPGLGRVRREWSERRLVVPVSAARVLALAAGESMIVRSMRLYVGDEPILTSSSYLPARLAGSSHRWQHVEAGEPAVTDRPVESAHLDERWRMPTQEESAALGIGPGTLVLEMARPCTVRASAIVTVSAGVLVVARGDLVAVRHESGP